MSGIYLIVLLFVWGFLTRLLWKNGRRFLEASFANRPVRIVLVVIARVWVWGQASKLTSLSRQGVSLHHGIRGIPPYLSCSGAYFGVS